MELLTLTNLQPNTGARHRKKRIGRGIGSGHGKTSTRGQKGQHARGQVRPGFEGGQTPLYRRLPKLRGAGKGSMPLGPTRRHYGIVNLSQLNKLAPQTVVTPELLRQEGIVKGRWDGVRLLGQGTLTVPLVIQLNHASAVARAAVEAAGGRVEIPGEAAE